MTASDEQLWLPRIKAHPSARLTLFCFPCAGSGFSMYSTWTLGRAIHTCPVQLPGRENRFREPAFTSLPPLIEKLSEVLGPHLKEPYAFFGHSMGALIAFELVRRLKQQKMPTPALLIVSSARAPHLSADVTAIHDLEESDFVREVSKRYTGIPPAILADPEMLRVYLRPMRADFSIIETYRYHEGELLESPLRAVGGMLDPRVSQRDLLAWKELTRGEFRTQMFPGGHFYLKEVQHQLLELIASDLQRVGLKN